MTRPYRVAAIGSMYMAVVASAMTPARAQTVAEHVERLNRLIELRDRMEAVADSGDLALARAGGLDSLHMGHILFYMAHDRRIVVEEGAAAAWDVLEAALGDEVDFLGRVSVTVGFSNDVVVSPRQMGRNSLSTYVSVPAAARVRRAVLAEISDWLTSSLDSVLREWIGLVVPVADTVFDWDAVWIEVATAASPLVRACRTGVERECLVAFGLEPVDDPIFDWYDAEGRRELVRRLPDMIIRDPEAVGVCLNRQWDDICVALLQALDDVPAPLSFLARHSLLRYALDRSPGGYGRLMRSAGPGGTGVSVAHALESVGQVELQTLLREWRTKVAQSRPASVSVRWPTAIATGVWILGLISIRLASSRRTR